MEALLIARREEAFLEDGGRGVFGQFEIVHTGIDRGVAAIARFHLANDGQTRVQVGQAT